MLPIASWERRFISKERFVETAEDDDSVHRLNDTAEADKSGPGKGESGGEGNGDDFMDGFYGMMLMSSTHHRFAGLFTIRKPGVLPVTQLLVRGSPVQCPDVHCCATACSDALAASRAMALGGLQAQCEAARGFHFKCSRVRGLGTRECYNRSPRTCTGSDEEAMVHLLMYSSNYTVRAAPPLCPR